jgi:hypothetical protein
MPGEQFAAEAREQLCDWKQKIIHSRGVCFLRYLTTPLTALVTHKAELEWLIIRQDAFA